LAKKSLEKKILKKKPAEAGNLNIRQLYDHFGSLFGEPPDMDINYNNLTIEDSVLNDILDRDVQLYFPKNNNKSPGPYMLLSEVFKSTYDSFSLFLNKLFNRIFQCGEYHQSWEEGRITPILNRVILMTR
jgi:hypothetical protein